MNVSPSLSRPSLHVALVASVFGHTNGSGLGPLCTLFADGFESGSSAFLPSGNFERTAQEASIVTGLRPPTSFAPTHLRARARVPWNRSSCRVCSLAALLLFAVPVAGQTWTENDDAMSFPDRAPQVTRGVVALVGAIFCQETLSAVFTVAGDPDQI